MSSTWLLLDVHNLCYRSFYALRNRFSHKGKNTSTIFGFLHTLLSILRTYKEGKPVFCFDSKRSIREELYPQYREKRKLMRQTMSFVDEGKALEELHDQINELFSVLRYIGYANVFRMEGYEADDIIAIVAKRCIPEGDRAVIVSSDEDLFQLLDFHVSIWSPRTETTFTRDDFQGKYRISPKQWALMKAMAGCSTDSVQGIRGIGEKRALQFLRGELSSTSFAYRQCVSPAGEEIVGRNLEVVRLPLKGTPRFILKEDKCKRSRWTEICKELGLRSLIKTPPF